eukprot:749426-Hanusia_phi.AAC.2
MSSRVPSRSQIHLGAKLTFLSLLSSCRDDPHPALPGECLCICFYYPPPAPASPETTILSMPDCFSALVFLSACIVDIFPASAFFLSLFLFYLSCSPSSPAPRPLLTSPKTWGTPGRALGSSTAAELGA